VRRLGVAGGVLIVTAALALPACGGSSDSSGKANTAVTTATTVINQQGGGGKGGGTGGSSGGAATTGGGTPHGTTTSTPHGTTTSTRSVTTTTRLNTIKPLPGQPVAPSFSSSDDTYAAPNNPKTDAYGQKSGVCWGTPPHTVATLRWSAYYTDFVEINRGSTNYPANHVDFFFVVQCPDPQVTSLFIAFVDLTAFGPGGEVTREVGFRVDPNYLP
jgi:hypothetical protein